MVTANYLIQRVLDAPMSVARCRECTDVATVRDYLKKLLKDLWQKGDGFDGKRPFGNSNWEYDIYLALVVAGLVPGTLDEDGFLHEFSDESIRVAYQMVREAIEALE